MRKLFYALMLLAAFATVAVGQETKVYVGFANLNYDQTTKGINDSIQGVNASIQRTFYGYGDLRLEGVVDGAAFFYVGERYYTVTAGPQVSVKLFHDKFNPFARLTFGALKYDEDYRYTYSAGVGADVNVTKNTFLRGTQDRLVLPGGRVAYRTTVGGGFRF